MKWLIVKKPIPDYTQWHKFFAWTPVTAGLYKHWLCFMYRRAIVEEGKDIEVTNRIIHMCGWKHWEYTEPTYYP